MKPHHFLLFSLLLPVSVSLLSISTSFAQADIDNTSKTTAVTSKAYNEKSKVTLIKKLAQLHHFQADFSQVVVDEDSSVVSEGSGTLAISKPNLVNWQTLLPDETTIISDGETLWFYDPFINQATAYNLTSVIANTPILLLTSESPELWQAYGVIEQSADSFVIESLDDNNQIKSLTLHFKGDELAQFSLLDATGQLSHIRLTDFDKNTKPDAHLFNFTVPQGVTVDDQR